MDGISEGTVVPLRPSIPMHRRLVRQPLSPRLKSLLRALEMAKAEGFGFCVYDVRRVETCWELLGADSTAHGFVLSLDGDRRCYLQYIAARANGEIEEDLQTLPMDDERYPSLEGGGVHWNDDDADEMNKLLAA